MGIAHPAVQHAGKTWRLPLALCAVGLAVYANSCSGQLLFDDYAAIAENPSIQSFHPSDWLLRAPSDSAIAGRPIPAFSVVLNYALGGLDLRGYHAVNIAVHLLAALALFGLVHRTLRIRQPQASDAADARWIACVVAGLWMLHPLVTEGVDYIVQRTESMMALGVLATLYAVARGANSCRRGWWDAAAVLSCAWAMASKEVAVVTPLLVLLYDRTFLTKTVATALRARWRLYLGLAATWLILAGLLALDSRRVSFSFRDPNLTVWRYALTQTVVVLHYLRLAVWPDPLVVDYADWPVVFTLRAAWPHATMLAALILITGWGLRRRRAWGFLAGAVFLILAPSSSVVPLITEVAAERRMYLPLCALVTLAVCAGWALLRRLVGRVRLRRAVAMVVAGAVAGLFSAMTIRRNHTYSSEQRMLEDVLTKRPKNVRARYNLGLRLAEQGRWPEAQARFQEVLARDPRHAKAHNNLGAVLTRQGRVEEAAWHYREAIRLKPRQENAYFNLGQILLSQGRAEEAIDCFATALQLNAEFAKASRQLGLALASSLARRFKERLPVSGAGWSGCPITEAGAMPRSGI